MGNLPSLGETSFTFKQPESIFACCVGTECDPLKIALKTALDQVLDQAYLLRVRDYWYEQLKLKRQNQFRVKDDWLLEKAGTLSKLLIEKFLERFTITIDEPIDRSSIEDLFDKQKLNEYIEPSITTLLTAFLPKLQEVVEKQIIQNVSMSSTERLCLVKKIVQSFRPRPANPLDDYYKTTYLDPMLERVKLGPKSTANSQRRLPQQTRIFSAQNSIKDEAMEMKYNQELHRIFDVRQHRPQYLPGTNIQNIRNWDKFESERVKRHKALPPFSHLR